MSVLKTYGEFRPDFAPSKTYRLTGDRISGMTDGKGAICQAIDLALSTERWRYQIFSADYGCELQALFGQQKRVDPVEIKLLIEEALLEDDRIKAIEDMLVEYEGDTAAISFTAVTAFGDIKAERRVSVG